MTSTRSFKETVIASIDQDAEIELKTLDSAIAQGIAESEAGLTQDIGVFNHKNADTITITSKAYCK